MRFQLNQFVSLLVTLVTELPYGQPQSNTPSQLQDKMIDNSNLTEEVRLYFEEFSCPSYSSSRIVQCHCYHHTSPSSILVSAPRFVFLWYGDYTHHCDFYTWQNDSDAFLLVKLKTGLWCTFSCEVDIIGDKPGTLRITYNVTGLHTYLEMMSNIYIQVLYVGLFFSLFGTFIFSLSLVMFRWHLNKHVQLRNNDIQNLMYARQTRASRTSECNEQGILIKAESEERRSALRKETNRSIEKHVAFIDEVFSNSLTQVTDTVDRSTSIDVQKRRYDSRKPKDKRNSFWHPDENQGLIFEFRKKRNRIKKFGSSVDKHIFKLMTKKGPNEKQEPAAKEMSSGTDRKRSSVINNPKEFFSTSDGIMKRGSRIL